MPPMSNAMAPTHRVALVTGGAQRVGRAIVETLSSRGFDVVFTYRSSKDAAAELENRSKREGYTVTAVEADLGKIEAFERPIRDAVDARGRLDLLVNCASIYEPDPPTPSPEFERKVFEINVHAPVTLSRWFALQLRASRGSVVNMLDVLATRPWPEYSVYCASKAALQNQTLSLARSLAPEVTVNGIAPGVVAWPARNPEAEKEKYLKRVPLARAGTPEDVATLVHFLATEGTYITGNIIRLDGGRSIT